MLALSVTWTTAVVQVSPEPEQKDARPVALPISDQPPDRPASTSVPARLGYKAASRGRVRGVSSAPTDDIPSAALAAYQRAEAVINLADKSCKLPWQLLAAVGRVESNHGRTGGNLVDADGISRPGVRGPRLDGTHGTARISDTDAGRVDDDPAFDRAVGPMQIIPSTWTEIAVDADGDGRRNPQDVDDAALAAAVYLCSGPDDLSTRDGLRRSVLRYNRSQEYVDLVLSIMAGYQDGDYAEAPNSVTPSMTLSADDHAGPVERSSPEDRAHNFSHGDSGPAQPTQPAPDHPDESPDSPQDPPPTEHEPLARVKKKVEETTTAAAHTVTGVLSIAQATTACAAAGLNALLMPRTWRECIDRHTR
ncbi:lytic murein transglycosylase [Nocardioides immobilis]|uniref:lytic murein transglycosylase n=1 Tax=Nocardioides immobilis TaxID=2049295 RepID=UPI001FE563CF|nr:lytic murein transglycosylase [Nocardioides immobilis]